MVDLTPFKSGLDAARAKMPVTCHDPRNAFLSMLAAAGFKPPKALVMGRIDRIDGPEDKPNKKSGWYSYNEIADAGGEGLVIGVAAYGDWKTGLSETWCSKSDNHMTTDERLRYHAAREALRAAQDAEKLTVQAEAAAKAYRIWQEAPDCSGTPYTQRKKINPSPGLKRAKDGRLIIPLADDKGQICTLQFIADDGEKRFLTGGRTKGAFFKIEGIGPVYVCEGYATGQSLFDATGGTVYCAMNAGNLYEVAAIAKAQNPSGRVIVAGDDDTATAGNPGRTKAEQAASGLGLETVFPIGHVDFNDMWCAMGPDAVRAHLMPMAEAHVPVNPMAVRGPGMPPGVLADIVGYYNATSGNAQPGFAIQTALAVGSIVLGRSYKTSFENFPSLFLLNVGKSGTGKEHNKTVVERILYAANMGALIAGDGYTSAGAVFSALLDRPRHISVIDEFGRYLEAGRDMGKGNHHQREANTKLMESIGRAHSVIRPPTYSTMTLKKADADAVKNRQVYNPAITLLTMTTPDTLFKTLDMGAIRDGFVNRFIISISDAQREVRAHKPPIDVPQRIIDWIAAVTARHGRAHIASEPAQPVTLEFSSEAITMQNAFQQYCIEKANYLERFGMAELPGRSNEMAMRISLICALARDPDAQTIEGTDMQWSIDYIRSCLETTIDRLKVSISSSAFEGFKKEILSDLRQRGADGITWAAMQKNAPYSQHKPKDLKEMLQALKDADLALDEPHISPQGGRPTIKWIALK